MYQFYLDNTLLPVAPEKLSLKIKNQNKTMNLINDAEINILKDAGLTEISFECLIPSIQYAFSNGNANPQDYLERFEKLKTSKKPFQFIVARSMPNGTALFNTNIKVSLESYNVNENAGEGFDLIVSIDLKQYREYGTKIVNVTNETMSQESTRTTETSPMPETDETYITKEGDSLYTISKQYYGDGSAYSAIYDANKDKIDKKDLAANTSLVIPRKGVIQWLN